MTLEQTVSELVPVIKGFAILYGVVAFICGVLFLILFIVVLKRILATWKLIDKNKEQFNTRK